MIKLITGTINSGKTTRMIYEYSRCDNGDGFASIKIMDGNRISGFDIMRLSTGHRMPFARKHINPGREWNQCCTFGPYSFSADAIRHIDDVIMEILDTDGSMVFLDELGSLELADRCLHGTAVKILSSGCDAVFTVRDTNLKDVKQKYDLHDAVIIETGERYV